MNVHEGPDPARQPIRMGAPLLLGDRQQLDQLATVDSFQHCDAQTIRPRWAGEPFDVHGCVQALFTIKLREQAKGLDQQAA